MPEAEPLQSDETATVTGTQTRRLYQKPVLVELGEMRDVTLSVSRDGNADGARTGNKRNTGRGGLNGGVPERRS